MSAYRNVIRPKAENERRTNPPFADDWWLRPEEPVPEQTPPGYVKDEFADNPYGGGPSNVMYGKLGVVGVGLSAQYACQHCGMKCAGRWVSRRWEPTVWMTGYGTISPGPGQYRRLATDDPEKKDWQCMYCGRRILVDGGYNDGEYLQWSHMYPLWDTAADISLTSTQVALQAGWVPPDWYYGMGTI